MSENVKVRYGKGSDNAVLLLAAAEELGLEASVVRTTSDGFEVPSEVADKAGVEIDKRDEEFEKEIEEARAALPEPDDSEDEPSENLSRSGFDEQARNVDPPKVDDDAPKAAPAKKAAAKKTTAKKTAAKKSTGKES